MIADRSRRDAIAEARKASRDMIRLLSELARMPELPRGSAARIRAAGLVLGAAGLLYEPSAGIAVRHPAPDRGESEDE